MMTETPQEPSSSQDTFTKVVYDSYNVIAKFGVDSTYSTRVAEAFGYTEEQLQSVPDDSNLGLSCGNPVTAASIKEGEVILDLGSGGGIDVLLAASVVGRYGQVIGLDASTEMVSLARRNARKQHLFPPQVAFVHAYLTEALPLASNSVDCVLSNCVINLLPPSGKLSLFREVYRVLKPGGRMVFDDIIAKKPFPDIIRNDINSHVACISGAIQLEEYRTLFVEAGFQDILFVDTHGDLNVYYQTSGDSSVTSPSCCRKESAPAGPLKRTDLNLNANNWVASYHIYGLKPYFNTPDQMTEAPFPLLRWWDAYPSIKSFPETISIEDVARIMQDGLETDYAIIDVRRNDHMGGHVRGSFQWPAQTFYDDMPAFYNKFGQMKLVIFYCSSSRGRGPRCAGWYQDFLDDVGVTTSAVYVLQGGVKAWLGKYEGNESLIDKD